MPKPVPATSRMGDFDEVCREVTALRARLRRIESIAKDPYGTAEGKLCAILREAEGGEVTGSHVYSPICATCGRSSDDHCDGGG